MMLIGRPAHRRLAAFSALLLGLLAAAASAPEDAASTLHAEALEWLRGYVRIDTTNPPGRESMAADYLAGILHGEGVATQLFVTPEGRTNLYAMLPASEPSESAETLVLLHHMDVVAAGEAWKHPPFGAEIHNQRVWGRGAIDAKSLGIAHLAAFIEHQRSAEPRTRNHVFLALADEESGGGQGARWLLDEHPELFTNVVAVLNEGGSNRMAGDRLLWWGIEVAQKRPLWLEISTQGRGGHGSSLNPGSATHRLLAGLSNLLMQPIDYRVSAAAHAYFGAIAGFHGEAFQEIFGHSDLETVQQRFADLLEGRNQLVLLPGMITYFHDTYQITSVETSSATVNMVPEQASALIDIRLLPDTDLEQVMVRLRKSFGNGASIEVLLSSPSAPSSSTDNEVYRALEKALGSRAPLVPSLITGTTDSRYFRERGITAYGFSPFLLSGQEARGIHGPNESIPIRKFDQGLDVMRQVVDLCLGL